MMRPRYFAVLASGPDAAAIAQAPSLRQACPELQAVYADKGLTVLSENGAGLPIGTHGVVLGRLFQRGQAGAIDQLGEAVIGKIFNSRGQALTERYWGGYIAFLAGEDGPLALRAPLGDLPCYHLSIPGGVVLASDIALLVAAGLLRPAIDHAALARYLAAEDLRRPETCLVGVSELQGGDRLSVSAAGVTVDAVWTPWTYTESSRQIRNSDDAASRVRGAAQHCVAAAASGYGRILLKLSGGLDSSIVAACLAQAGQAFDCVTLTTDNPAGDERDYAAQVAAHLDVSLSVQARRLGDVAIEHSEAARLPRPTARSFAQASIRATREIAAATGADAVMDGGGGDNVFCSLQSVRPIVDCMLDGESGQVWPTIRSIAELTETGMPQVAWRTWLARSRRRTAFRFRADLRFLSKAARIDAEGALAHRWLVPPPGALPGKAAHVAMIMTAQSVVEGFDVQDDMPTLSPLIAQPLVETCLQVPTWLWFEEGRNRTVARRGFAGLLPREIVGRRSKGSPDSFIIALYDAQRPLIRTMLLDGTLASRGLLDTHALARVLDDAGPVTGHDFFRIMRLIDVEAWARAV